MPPQWSSQIWRRLLARGQQNLVRVAPASSSSSVSNSLISTPIFYANGAPHIGHLHSLCVADALHRWERLKSPAGKHILTTGTDEHGTKIERTAREKGQRETKRYVDEISDLFRQLCIDTGVHDSYRFTRTTEQNHRVAVEKMWNSIAATGALYKSSYSGFYSVRDEAFVTEQNTVLNEKTGIRTSLESGAPVEWLSEESWMFDMSGVLPKIKKWLEKGDAIQPPTYLTLVLQQLESQPPVLTVSRPRERCPWGIPVPGDETQTIYVWIDALTNYIAATGWPRREADVWPPTYHVIGKDIVRFHAIYWPAMLAAAGIELPQKLYVHGHWTVDSEKMSKSVGNVLSPEDAANSLGGMEPLRYYMLKQATPDADSNFATQQAVFEVNADLVNNLGNQVQRALNDKLNPKRVYPERPDNANRLWPGAVTVDFRRKMDALADKCAKNYDRGLFHRSIRDILEVSDVANAYFQQTRPWIMAPPERPEIDAILYASFECARRAAILLSPVAPRFAKHQLDRLAVPEEQRTLESARHESPGGWKLPDPKMVAFMQRLDVPRAAEKGRGKREQKEAAETN